MKDYYLAVDIGASSGRHILGSVEEGKMILEEIHRFENRMIKRESHLCWDMEYLFAEIKIGMKKCKELGKLPSSIGVDTWGVDYVLLDKGDQIIGRTYGYRDNRTKGMDSEVYKRISEAELYERTGIQKQIFNTIYQLMSVKVRTPELMEKAETLLMIPDYFHFLLTGQKMPEYTNATTGQLVSPDTKKWDCELIERLGYKRSLFKPLHMPALVPGI